MKAPWFDVGHRAVRLHVPRITRSTTSRDREGAGMPRATCKVLLCDTGRWRCHAGFAAGVGRVKLLLSRTAFEHSGGGLGRSLALGW